jgi:TolB-like protein/AraC-like DNA-binding protein/Tfp pilus assembly protein PilF
MSQPLSMDQVFLSKLNEIIRNNLENEKLGVEDLSREMGMSYSRIHRKLKSLTNKKVSQYIREVRLQQAMEMLLNNVATVSEIAFRVGFSDPAYFNHCFHGYYGYPPGEVKKRKPENGIITGDHLIPEPTINQRSKGRRILLLAVFMCIGIAYAAFKIMDRSRQTQDLAKLEKSIAVLPFINDSPDQENTYFINGVMEEIFTDLQKIKSFRIISRTSAEKFRGSNKLTIPKIAKALDVNYIVEGSGQKSGNRYVLRVQLIVAHNERHLWAESFEVEIKDTKDIFKIQSQVAQEIASALKATITPEEKQRIENIATTDLTAYDFYQRGREEQRKYGSDNSNKQALNRAEYLYKKALKYDSTFAGAYAGLADVFWDKHVYESYYAKNYLDSVIILADRALFYDDHLAEAYYSRADYYRQIGKNEQAIKEYDKALKYNPNYWEVYRDEGLYVYVMDYNHLDYIKALEYLYKAVSLNHGRELPDLLRLLGDVYGSFAGFYEKADYYFQEALKLDDDSISYFNCLAARENVFRNYEKTVEFCKTGYARDSNKVEIISSLAYAYYILGRYKESLKYVKKFENRLETLPYLEYGFMKRIGYVYWQNGYKKEASQWFKKHLRMSEESIKMGRHYATGIDANYDLAAVYAFLGDKEKAYENLRIIDKIHACPLWLVTEIQDEPLFNSLRNEPEFQKIVQDLETKHQAEHERVRRWLVKTGNL